jgi:glycerophosphoryl diester phosphodiesterase
MSSPGTPPTEALPDAAPAPSRLKRVLKAGLITLLVMAGLLVVLGLVAYHALKLPPSPSVDHLRDKSIVISHRGESARAPENTLEAIRLAHSLGAKVVELDVSMSKDGVPILMHDCTVDRTVEGTGEARQMTLAELQALKIKTKDPKFADAKIPTLEAAIKLCLELGLMIEIELKAYYTPEQIMPDLLEFFKTYDLYDKAWVASFYPNHLYKLRSQEPRILTAFLIHPNPTDSTLVNDLLKSDWVPTFLGVGLLRPFKTIVDEDYIKRWEARGKVVNVWVINTAKERENMKSLDVAYSTDCFGGQCQPFELNEPGAGSYHCLDEKPE